MNEKILNAPFRTKRTRAWKFEKIVDANKPRTRVWHVACPPNSDITKLMLTVVSKSVPSNLVTKSIRKEQKQKIHIWVKDEQFFGKWKGCDLIKNVGRYRKMAPFKRVRKEDFRYSIVIRIDRWTITRYSRNGIRNLQDHFRAIRVGSKAGSKQKIFLGQTKRSKVKAVQLWGLKRANQNWTKILQTSSAFRSAGFH